MINKILNLIKKHRQIVLYTIFGFFTTVINFLSFTILTSIFFNKNDCLSIQISNSLSWIFAFLFAYVANKLIVFRDKNKKNNSFFKFLTSRVFTLIIEALGIFVFISCMGFNKYITKAVLQFGLVILNFVLSKFWVFKHKN